MSEPMPETQPAKDHWIVDKRIPLAGIIALAGTVIVQTFLAGQALSSINNKLDDHERRIVNGERIDERRETELRSTTDRLARIETNISNIDRNLAALTQQRTGSRP